MNEALLIIAALGAGLVAGFFFSFSFVVMGSLARLPPAQGIAAMNAINVVVLNPWFFGAFFGTALVSIVIAVLAFMPWGAASALMLGGAGLYLVGAIWVTMAFNVPLNNALAKADAGSEAGLALWQRYLRVWTAWNHVRTAAPLAAAACFVLALL
jgi:uncharacterized membrane protein